MHGEAMKSMLQTESTKDLACKFEYVWGFQRSCCTEFDENEDADWLSYVCRTLEELQKSSAVFKNCVIDFSNLLHRGFKNIDIAQHNGVLKVDFGYSNAKCQCFECPEASGSVFEGNARKDSKFDPSFFFFHR